MSDRVQIITAYIGLIGLVFQGVMAYLMARLKAEQMTRSRQAAAAEEGAAIQVKKVARSLRKESASAEQRFDDLAKVGRATHTLVNSNMEIELKKNAELSRWKSDRTGALEDIRAAEVAEEKYAAHMVKQAAVDARTAVDAKDKGEVP